MAEELVKTLRKMLTNALVHDEKDYVIEILNDKFERGDGYVGELVSAKLTNTKNGENQFIVVKQEKLKNEKTPEIFSILFQNENHFYGNIWTKLKRMYAHKTGSSLDLIPACLGISNGKRKRLAMVDLMVDGFVSYERTKCFDEDHLVMILEKYGLFHGLSVVFKQTHLKEYEELVAPLHNLWKLCYEHYKGQKSNIRVNVNCAINFFDPSTEDHIIQKLKSFEKDGVDLTCKIFCQDKREGLILHGDGWSNNFLFKYDVSSIIFYGRFL